MKIIGRELIQVESWFIAIDKRLKELKFHRTATEYHTPESHGALNANRALHNL